MLRHFIMTATCGMIASAIYISHSYATANNDQFEIQKCLEATRTMPDPQIDYSCINVVVRNCQGYGPKICWSRSFKAWDLMLNDVYVMLGDTVRLPVFKSIREAQRAWIIFKEKDCYSAAEIYKGGSQEQIRRLQCLSKATALRTLDLLDLLEETSL